MANAVITILKKLQISRLMCILLLVFSCAFLTGCDEPTTQGEEIEQVEKSKENCFTCTFFELTFQGFTTTSEAIVQRTAKPMIPFLGACYALWLALHVMKLVSSMVEVDTSVFWKELASHTFFLTIGAILLRDLSAGPDASVVMDMLVKPIFSGFVDFGLMVTNALPDVDVQCPTGDPQNAMICLVSEMQKRLGIGLKLGMITLFLPKGLFHPFAGLFILLMTVGMMFYFPILLLDIVFRYGIIICMLPLSICAYCFKATRAFAAKTVQILVEIGVAVVGMSVFINLCAIILDKYIDSYFKDILGPIASFVADGNKAAELSESTGVMGMIFVMFFLMLFGGVFLSILKPFGALGGIGSTVEGAGKGMRDTAKTGQKLASFGYNLKNRAKDLKDKKTIKGAAAKKAAIEKDAKDGKIDKKEKEKRLNALEKDRTKALDRMERRGYLKRDGNGDLHETKAYLNMGNGGLRHNLKHLGQDWGVSSSEASEGRHSDKNRVTTNQVENSKFD